MQDVVLSRNSIGQISEELLSRLTDIANSQKNLQTKIETLPKILVVGDVMIDRYWTGIVERISPEAPVPIVNVQDKSVNSSTQKSFQNGDRLGGAANVAKNIISLGCSVAVLGLCGIDDDAKILANMLKKNNIEPHIIELEEYRTIVKLRISHKNQQIIRLDFENKDLTHLANQFALIDKFNEIIDNFDLVIFSDYAKGSLMHIDKMIHSAKSKGKIVFVDPKGDNYDKYFGVDLITPNKRELEQIIGLWRGNDQSYRLAIELMIRSNFGNLLLTRSEEGMTLFGLNNQLDQSANHSGINCYAVDYPAFAQEVYDVSGAGDTVIATIAVMLLYNFSLYDAVLIANIAASIVVTRFGVAHVSCLDILSIMKEKLI